MYNRYIPADMSFTRVEGPAQSRPAPGNRPAPFRLPDFLSGGEGLSGLFKNREGGGLPGLLKSLRLDRIDSGDILLLLIALYLLVEGDDLELAVALGLTVLLGLGEDSGPPG